MSAEDSRPTNGARRGSGAVFGLVAAVAMVALLQYRATLVSALLPPPAPYDPAAHGEIVLLTAPGCRFCAREKRYLDQHGFPYREEDVSDPVGGVLMAGTGAVGVPVLLVGDEVVQGFDPLRIRAALNRAATRRHRRSAVQKP